MNLIKSQAKTLQCTPPLSKDRAIRIISSFKEEIELMWANSFYSHQQKPTILSNCPHYISFPRLFLLSRRRSKLLLYKQILLILTNKSQQLSTTVRTTSRSPHHFLCQGGGPNYCMSKCRLTPLNCQQRPSLISTVVNIQFYWSFPLSKRRSIFFPRSDQ